MAETDIQQAVRGWARRLVDQAVREALAQIPFLQSGRVRASGITGTLPAAQIATHDIITKHTADGLTTGHVMTATSPTAFGFAAAAGSVAHAATHVTGGTDVVAGALAAGSAGLMTGADKTKLDGVAAGAVADHTAIANKGTNTHAQLDTGLTDSTGHIAAAAPHSGHAPTAKGVTNGDTHDHVGGDGALIPSAALAADVRPCVRVTNTLNQSIPDNTERALTFNGEDYDTDTMHEAATNPSYLTATTAGKYHVTASYVIGDSATGDRRISIVKAGVAVAMVTRPATGYTYMEVSTDVDLAAGGYVQAWAFQSSGGALNVLTHEATHFEMHRIG